MRLEFPVRLLTSLFASVFLSSATCLADLTFTVSDNGDNTTDWTISGSGTTQSAVAADTTQGSGFAGTDWTSDSFQVSTSGFWAVGGVSTNLERAGHDSFGNDQLNFNFSSEIAEGTSLSDASGTVTFSMDFANLTLPATSSATGAFGDITIVAAAVPEPSTTAFAVAICLLGFGAAYRRRKQQALSDTPLQSSIG